MNNTAEGIHTTTNPKGTEWVNQTNGVVCRAIGPRRRRY